MLELIGIFILIFCIEFVAVFGIVLGAIKLGWLPGVKWPWEN